MSQLSDYEFTKLRAALCFACTVGRISEQDCDGLLAKLDPSDAGQSEPANAAPTPAEVDAEAAAALQAAEQAEAQKAAQNQPLPTPPAEPVGATPGLVPAPTPPAQ